MKENRKTKEVQESMTIQRALMKKGKEEQRKTRFSIQYYCEILSFRICSREYLQNELEYIPKIAKEHQ